MRIGIDFDNTIVCYDDVFHQVARERDLISPDVPKSKEAVRDNLRHQGLEEVWIEMQGYVYGTRMNDASAFPGVARFFQHCRQVDVETCIISHKTRHPFSGPAYDLHEAARGWLAKQEFMNGEAAGPAPQVFLELTKQDKLQRIDQEGCDFFIDDLPEFLSEPAFSRQAKRIHFDPCGKYAALDHPFQRASSWQEIQNLIL